MTRIWKVILVALVAGITIFAIACGGGNSNQSSENTTSTNGTPATQQVNQEDLEECPPRSQTIVSDMKCVARDVSVTAGPNSYVVARGGSTVYAGLGSWVEAYPSSRVYASKGSTVRYRTGAVIHIEEEGADVERVRNTD